MYGGRSVRLLAIIGVTIVCCCVFLLGNETERPGPLQEVKAMILSSITAPEEQVKVAELFSKLETSTEYSTAYDVLRELTDRFGLVVPGAVLEEIREDTHQRQAAFGCIMEGKNLTTEDLPLLCKALVFPTTRNVRLTSEKRTHFSDDQVRYRIGHHILYILRLDKEQDKEEERARNPKQWLVQTLRRAWAREQQESQRKIIAGCLSWVRTCEEDRGKNAGGK